MIGLGLVMLLSVAGYYAYSYYSRASFDDLSFDLTTAASSDVSAPVNGTEQGASFTVVEVTDMESADPTAEPALAVVDAPDTISDEAAATADATGEAGLAASDTEVAEASSDINETETVVSTSVEVASDTDGDNEAASETNGVAVVATEPADSENASVDAQPNAGSYNGPFLMDSFAMSYPGVDVHPKYWDDPLWAGSDRLEVYLLPEGFAAVSYKSDDYEWLGEAPANRMVIADIGVDATVNGLRIIDLGDSQAYETPKNIVGHIPSTANPGEYSNGWYFGHLQSPIRGEGNVFRHLPKLSQLIRDGDPIFVTLYSTDGAYLYQVVKGEVVHPSELELSYTEDAEITLVTCYPPLVYDHRYVVSAKLVGVKN